MTTARAVLLLAVFLTSAAEGQTITGQVRDQTSQPVGLGFVVLLDSTGLEVSRVLTERDGSFAIDTPGPGRYRIRSERIGYRPAFSNAVRVVVDETPTVNLEVRPIPVALDEITVEGRSDCTTTPETGRQTATLWEEIAKALTAATWTRGAGFRYHFLLHERELDRRARRIESQALREERGLYRVPFRAADPARLIADGFVTGGQEQLWFYAPDTDVMSDTSFLRTHCFHVTRDDDRFPGQVGLAFEPVSGRDVSDIEGTLWVDAVSGALQRLVYHYRDLPIDLDDQRVGGELQFFQLPNGAWIVRQWNIRMPLLGIDERLSRRGRSRIVIRGYYDMGGEIASVQTPHRDTLYLAPRATVGGHVRDHVGAVLSNATVELVGTGYRTSTDEGGRFVLRGFLDGEYGISFTHRTTRELGYTPPETRLHLARGETTLVDLQMPGPAGIFASVCPRQAAIPDVRALVGRVTTGDLRTPVRGAVVRVFWQEGEERAVEALRSDGSLAVRNRQAEDTTDAKGWYKLCGVPFGEMLIVAAGRDSSWGAPAVVAFEADGVWRTAEPCLDGSVEELMQGTGSFNADLRARARCYGSRRQVTTDTWVWHEDLSLKPRAEVQGRPPWENANPPRNE